MNEACVSGSQSFKSNGGSGNVAYYDTLNTTDTAGFQDNIASVIAAAPDIIDAGAPIATTAYGLLIWVMVAAIFGGWFVRTIGLMAKQISGGVSLSTHGTPALIGLIICLPTTYYDASTNGYRVPVIYKVAANTAKGVYKFENRYLIGKIDSNRGGCFQRAAVRALNDMASEESAAKFDSILSDPDLINISIPYIASCRAPLVSLLNSKNGTQYGNKESIITKTGLRYDPAKPGAATEFLAFGNAGNESVKNVLAVLPYDVTKGAMMNVKVKSLHAWRAKIKPAYKMDNKRVYDTAQSMQPYQNYLTEALNNDSLTGLSDNAPLRKAMVQAQHGSENLVAWDCYSAFLLYRQTINNIVSSNGLLGSKPLEWMLEDAKGHLANISDPSGDNTLALPSDFVTGYEDWMSNNNISKQSAGNSASLHNMISGDTTYAKTGQDVTWLVQAYVANRALRGINKIYESSVEDSDSVMGNVSSAIKTGVTIGAGLYNTAEKFVEDESMKIDVATSIAGSVLVTLGLIILIPVTLPVIVFLPGSMESVSQYGKVLAVVLFYPVVLDFILAIYGMVQQSTILASIANDSVSSNAGGLSSTLKVLTIAAYEYNWVMVSLAGAISFGLIFGFARLIPMGPVTHYGENMARAGAAAMDAAKKAIIAVLKV